MYKKFFIVIIFITFLIDIFFIILAYSMSNKNIWGNLYPANILNEHREIAEKIDRSKILIIGGSSTFFGVDTELMSERLNYPVINFGVHAGLRLDYILYDAKKYIKYNDIVILPLEYAIYYEDNYSEARLIQIWQSDKQYFEKLQYIDKLRLLWSIPLSFESKVLGTYIGVPTRQEHNLEYININKNGDSINTLESKNIYEAEPFDKDNIYLDDNIREIIIDFLNYCKGKNVKVFITYPPFYYKQNYFDSYNLEQINKIDDFWQEQNVIILGQYTDFIYTDKNDFYDTRYHLNIRGREKRTEKLIELLKPYINDN